MKFEHIEIQNFKPYYETERLDFDLTSDKPLTLVRGKNDIGKTAILEAIKFCLYGFDVTESQQARTQCINRKAAVDGLEQTSVTLRVQHDGKSYELTRGHYFSQVTDPGDREAGDRFMRVVVSPETEDEEVFIDTANEDDEISDYEKFVSDLLPAETVRFFMFDGDRIDEFADKLQEGNPNVKHAIELILGIREIQNAIRDLDNIAIDHYESKYNDASSEAEDYRAKKTERQSVSEEISEFEDERDELLEEIREKERERDKVRQDLAEEEDLENKYKRLARSKAQLHGLDAVPDAEEVLDESTIEDITEDGSIVDQIKEVRQNQQELYKQFGPAAAVVAARSLEDNIPSESTAIPDAIREVLRERASECLVCGQSFEGGSEEIESDGGDVETSECTLCGKPLEVTREDLHERLEEVRQDTTKQANRLSTTVENLIELESDHDLSQQALEQRFESLEEDYSKLVSRREKLDTRISGLENELENAMDQTERQSLRDRRDQLENQLTRLNRQVGEVRTKIRQKETELEEINQELDRMEGATDREKYYKRLMDASSQTKNVFEETKDRFVERQRGQVETEASELFMDMTNKDDVYNGLDIDRDYRLRIEVDGEVRDIAEQDPSQGARQIIAYAFNAGIARSTDREAPFVIDTPTGRLDDDHKDELLRKLPEFGDQVVILYQPRELTDGDIDEFEDLDLIQSHYRITRGAVPEISKITRIDDNGNEVGS